MLINDADIPLWEAYKAGDRDAFGELFRRYYPLMYQFGSRITDNQDLLKDSIQEIFVELWQNKSHTVVRSIKSYLFKSLKYKFYRDARRGKHVRTVTEDAGFELSYESLLIAHEEDEERISTVIRALDSLSHRQKEIIYLKFYQELSYEEVSEIMDINYQAARNLLYQAVKALKSALIFLFMVVLNSVCVDPSGL